MRWGRSSDEGREVWRLRSRGETLATVAWSRDPGGWYWYGLGRNSLFEGVPPWPDPEAAKAAAFAALGAE